MEVTPYQTVNHIQKNNQLTFAKSEDVTYRRIGRDLAMVFIKGSLQGNIEIEEDERGMYITLGHLPVYLDTIKIRP